MDLKHYQTVLAQFAQERNWDKFHSPKNLSMALTVEAGGLQSGHMMWLQLGCCAEKLVSVEVKLPVNWDELIRKAEEDLGPLLAN